MVKNRKIINKINEDLELSGSDDESDDKSGDESDDESHDE